MVWNIFAFDDTTGPKQKNQDNAVANTAVEEAYECDYERDCTPLYRAIENAIEEKEFEHIVKFLDTGYWQSAFFSDPINPADQARTWVTRFDPGDPNKVRWSQLPLHLAIVCNAPAAIIGRLVKLYPQALRCTDDQHMLPLHLALRHGSDDEIVAFLLMKFPDAVNARGKNARTAVDCALRAKDKLRGKILEIFVEKTRGRRSNGILKEQQELRAKLTKKEAEVEELHIDMEGMTKNFEELKELKNTTEQDLLLKIQEMEQIKGEMSVEYQNRIERMQNDHMIDTMDLQKKLESLKTINNELVAIERAARAEEAAIRDELEQVHTQIVQSASPEDMDLLKMEVEELRAFRLERIKSMNKNKIEDLKGELAKTIEETKKADAESKNELKAELKSLKAMVGKLEKQETSAQSNAEVIALRNEVDALRNELRDKAESFKTKSEVTELKEHMEAELENAEGKTNDEMLALKKAIQAAAFAEAESKTHSELSAVKQELESLKKEMKNKELINKTKRDLEEFKGVLMAELEVTNDHKTSKVLSSMQKNIDELDQELQQCKSGSQIFAVKMSIDSMKNEVQKNQLMIKILKEGANIKSDVDVSVKMAQGKTLEDLNSMKKAIKALNESDLITKSVDHLSEIKLSLNEVKSDLKDLQAAARAQSELCKIKQSLANEIKNVGNKNEREISMMKTAIDDIIVDVEEGKELKTRLALEIAQNNAAICNELIATQSALDGLDVKSFDRKDTLAWKLVQSEVSTAKGLLDRNKLTEDNVKAELDLIKKAAEDKKKSEDEFISLREEMKQMKLEMELKGKEDSSLKKELEEIKKRADKKKKGLKKFFARRFTAGKRIGMDGSSFGELPPTPRELNISTIAPPSMMNIDYENPIREDSSDEEEANGESICDDLLNRTSISEAVQSVQSDGNESKQSAHTKASKATVSSSKTRKSRKSSEPTLAKESSPKPSTSAGIASLSLVKEMRKVQTMDPRIASPHAMKRTKSKVMTQPNGEVELETVDS